MALTGIIGAMDLEMEGLIGKLEEEERCAVSGMTFHRGKLFGRDAVLAVSGIGKCFAALCAQTMILKYHPDRILNIGVAGSLSLDISLGDVAVATDVVQYDMDTSALGDPVGFLSGIGLVKLPCDGKLVRALSEAAESLSLSTYTGTLASGDRFLDGSAEKGAVARRFGAIACEMEGGGVAQTCYINRIPFALMRSISDSADGGCEDYERFKRQAAANSSAVLERLFEKID